MKHKHTRPVRLLPKYRVVRLVIRAERVTVRARNELDALNRVETFGGWKWWPAHGSDGDPVGDVTCERVIAHRKRGEIKETTLAKSFTDPDAQQHPGKSVATDTEGGDHD